MTQQKLIAIVEETKIQVGKDFLVQLQWTFARIFGVCLSASLFCESFQDVWCDTSAILN